MEDKKQLEEGPKYEGQKEPPKMSKNAKAIKEFTDLIMKDHKDIIKSMWIFSVEDISKSKDFTVILLLNDLEHEYKLGDVAKTVKEAKKIALDKYEINLHAGYYKVTEYFEKIMENDLDVFNELKNSIPVYDPSGFFRPLKKLLEKGEILGTKESLMRLGDGITARFRTIHSLKLNVLENLFNAVVDSGQALLISKKYPIPLQTQVPEMLETLTKNDGIIEKRYVKYCKDVISVYKDVEHEDKKDIRGWELDILSKKAGDFVQRVVEIMEKDSLQNLPRVPQEEPQPQQEPPKK
ncbi:MAG: hypothetical protein JW716_02500 [Candidatus Aenigmarchaeota archaeon]|nr:hypothetical protein [Candidatus Aenigmarchaeota archaeon]